MVWLYTLNNGNYKCLFNNSQTQAIEEWKVGIEKLPRLIV